MVEDLVSDAARLASELPIAPDGIATLMHRHGDVLDAVERPALVHFDLWDGNVFVDRAPGGRWRITGVIDGERAFFGDPVAECVSLALYRDVGEIPELLTGYAAGSDTPPTWLSVGSPSSVELISAGRRRPLLYSAYLYLVMCIEGVTRGFDGPEHEGFRQRVLALLELQLERLDSRRSS